MKIHYSELSTKEKLKFQIDKFTNTLYIMYYDGLWNVLKRLFICSLWGHNYIMIPLSMTKHDLSTNVKTKSREVFWICARCGGFRVK